MPVRLDKVPPLALRPAQPGFLRWFGLLLLCLLVGVGGGVVFGDDPLPQWPVDFWELAVGIPIFGWCVLSFLRMAVYFGQQGAAEGWDAAREEDLIRKIRQGRRSQQLLSVSLHTAFRNPDDQSDEQLNKLGSGIQSLKAQPTRLGEAPLRHSRLYCGTDESSNDLLLRVMTQVLSDLAQTLAQVPGDRPLALLLEIESSFSEDFLCRVWQQAWAESGIRQITVPVEGCGLAAVDRWLDQRINDQAMLMVVALQLAPEQTEGTAEVAVGLLLGNRLMQSILAPIAYLHRPEQERKPTDADLLCATRQALDWVPLQAQAVKRVWLTGIDPQRHAAIATVLMDVPMPVQLPKALCNLDALLGQPGKASPWLAIAAAAQTIERGAGPQFIFSGGTAADGLWSTVLMPVSPLSK
ncbi:hypothetical protein [Pseudomonas sp. GL-R-26]|uniref:hypothetical protein n=1 Tax=Pseudomonas sp. GL-R-26 TaxID=2832392 RepID=UPI001CBF805D|nr:hypothetical protein [Pseudomonas sp. GL-R-26]